jgi:glucan phosphoethanolaminetransferase (alkaline phosphatase superfamily)
MKTTISIGSPIRRSRGRFHNAVSILSVVATLAALVALWAPAYLGIADNLGGSLSARSETLAWLLLAVGLFGWGSVFYLAWLDTHDPEWRAAHGLPRRTQSKPARH